MRSATQPSVEDWARAYIRADTLAHKLAPPPRSTRFDGSTQWPRRPGRPPELIPIDKPPKTPKPGALRDPRKRAQLLHTFFHHELQAAELMAWALLRFPETPLALRRGLLAICDDEIRHMGLYADRLQALGFPVGSFGVRDWFWDQVPQCESPLAFVSLLGIGFEGANLDHAARFTEALQAAGDPESAGVQARIGAEEIPHVRFAVTWFERWAGPLAFDAWCAELPPPLTPIVMRGRPLARPARRRAGQTDSFLDALDGYSP